MSTESIESHDYEDGIFQTKLQKLYRLVHLTKSTIHSGVYAATGIKLNQKKLVISFLFTLIRDFFLAYSVRGSIKLIPKLVKMIQSFRIDIVQLLGESFGLGTAKFGLFISLFFSSYKASEKILSHWNFSKNSNSLLSGGLASFSFLVMSGEEVEFRWTLAQYVAVRAMQCLYNHIIRIYPQFKPYCYFGDVGLFALSSAQLLYGYFVRPNSLDPDYRNFVEKMTCTPRRIVEANRQFLRDNRGRLEGRDLLDLALTVENVHSLSPSNLPSQVCEALITNSHISALPCSILHFNEACPERIFNVFSLVFKQAFPMYFSLHLIPRFLFKTQIQNLFEEIIHAAKNALQSSSFLATCGSIFQSFLCSLRLAKIQDWKYYYWMIGLIAGLGILIEKKHRRSELALYVLPKALQALYRLMLNRNLMIKIPKGEYLLFSFSISVLMNYYRKEPESMTPLVSRIFKRFL